MTKRLQFTNTKKWTQAWFRKLKPQHKLFWLYVNDMCDHAGFWNVDIELAELCISMSLDGEELLNVFKDKIKVLNEDLWWLKEYCIIQSKALLTSENGNKARLSSYQLLFENGVYEEYVTLFFKTYPGLAKANDRLKVKVKDNVEVPVEDKDMLKDKLPVEEEDKREVTPVIQSEYASSGDRNIQEDDSYYEEEGSSLPF